MTQFREVTRQPGHYANYTPGHVHSRGTVRMHTVR